MILQFVHCRYEKSSNIPKLKKIHQDSKKLETYLISSQNLSTISFYFMDLYILMFRDGKTK